MSEDHGYFNVSSLLYIECMFSIEHLENIKTETTIKLPERFPCQIKISEYLR